MRGEFRRGCIGCLRGLCSGLCGIFFVLGCGGVRVRNSLGKCGFEKYTTL